MPSARNRTGHRTARNSVGNFILARSGAHTVYEGDWSPRRIVLLKFPSIADFDSFYYGAAYQGIKAIRDECSSARLVTVEGYRSSATT